MAFSVNTCTDAGANGSERIKENSGIFLSTPQAQFASTKKQTQIGKYPSTVFSMYLRKHTIKPVLSGHSKKTKNVFQERLTLNAGQKYCRMLQESILHYFPPALSKTFVLSIFEWQLKTGFTVTQLNITYYPQPLFLLTVCHNVSGIETTRLLFNSILFYSIHIYHFLYFSSHIFMLFMS